MTGKTQLRGIATISLYADDMAAARKWYSELFGMEPYFARPDEQNPAYLEYRVGDYEDEVGIIDRKFAPPTAAKTPGGAVVFWHVDDLETSMERVKQMGATEFEPRTERGAGFITATFLDPFGNILGLMYNPHYLKILDSKK